MASHALFVFSNPVEGKEAEFNEWYNNIHLGEVCQVPGIVSAQRFKVSDVMPGVTDHRYVAIYQLETDDPGATMKALTKALPTMNMSDAIDTKTAKMTVAEVCSDVVVG